HALVERLEDRLGGGGLRLRERGDLVAGLLREAGELTRRRGDVIRELAERHRLRVRLPGELVVRNTLEHAAGRGGFAVELGEDRIDGFHRVLLRMWRGRQADARWSRRRSRTAFQPRPWEVKVSSVGRSSCVRTTSVEAPRSRKK